MFTGLVQDVGRVRVVRRDGESALIELETRLAGELAVGDSLAVDGVCLTVTATADPRPLRSPPSQLRSPPPQLASATAIPETLARTTLGALAPGARVNLEAALRAGDRMGGHVVQGHVDGVGTILATVQRGLSRELEVECAPELLRYVVEKGSIAVHGVSLTVARVDDARRAFGVALIPHTLGATTLDAQRPGDRVNLEVDILAKYVERMLRAVAPAQGGRITEAWLREQGY